MIEFRGALLRERGLDRPYEQSRPLEIVELALPEPGEGEILVKIEAASLCRSDLSVVNGARVWPLPMVLGHEAAGTVAALGKDVSELGEGDRVVLVYLPQCGECERCRAGEPWLCAAGAEANQRGELLTGGTRLTHQGEPIHHHMGLAAFAEYALVAAKSAVKAPATLPATDLCVFGCAVLCGAGTAINTAGVGPGDTVAVVGLGAVGLSAVMGAKAAGAASVLAIDRLESKLELAKRIGADEVALADEVGDRGMDHAIEASGTLEGFELAAAMVRRGGTVTSLGLPGPGVSYPLILPGLVAGGLTVKGSYLGSCDVRRDMPTFIDWYRAGRLGVANLVSHRLGLEDLNVALDRLAEGKALRQVIEMQTE